MNVISLKINGLPEGWPRPRPRHGSHGYITPFRQWRKTVADIAVWSRPKPKWTGPVFIRLVFVMPRPKSRPRDHWHVVKPDGDNLKKLTIEALTDAGWWKDDCQVAKWAGEKRLAKPGEKPGCEITALEMPLEVVG
jgi:Holliday junction resolvase RusA-like endonuclease